MAALRGWGADLRLRPGNAYSPLVVTAVQQLKTP
jgi:hypothetical protein